MPLTHPQMLLAVVIVGVLTGVGWVVLRETVTRRAPNDAERSRRSRILSGCVNLLLAVVFAIRCVVIQDTARYLFIPLAVFFAVSGLLELRKGRKAPVPPS
jgi:uncharacterized membrane protein HdeD (DUF308 family)